MIELASTESSLIVAFIVTSLLAVSTFFWMCRPCTFDGFRNKSDDLDSDNESEDSGPEDGVDQDSTTLARIRGQSSPYYEITKNDITFTDPGPGTTYSSDQLYRDCPSLGSTRVSATALVRNAMEEIARTEFFRTGNTSEAIINILRKSQRLDCTFWNGRCKLVEVRRTSPKLTARFTLNYLNLDINGQIVTQTVSEELVFVEASNQWQCIKDNSEFNVIYRTRKLEDLICNTGPKAVLFRQKGTKMNGIVDIPPGCPLPLNRVYFWTQGK
jgi:hypothetical protein